MFAQGVIVGLLAHVHSLLVVGYRLDPIEKLVDKV